MKPILGLVAERSVEEPPCGWRGGRRAEWWERRLKSCTGHRLGGNWDFIPNCDEMPLKDFELGRNML